MELKNNEVVSNQIIKLIETIDEYYDYSFKVRNDRCFVILIKLIGQLEDLLTLVKDVEQQLCFGDILNGIANAMANKDYVLLRDLLHYELRINLNKMQSIIKH